jgi:hypothetical protein
MTRKEYIIVRSPNIPPLIKWSKEGIILLNKLNPLNLSELFNTDPNETLYLIDEFFDKVEFGKHIIQLREVKKHFMKLNEIYK